MAGKSWIGSPDVIRLTWDFAKNGGAVGTINLGDLPTNFVVEKVMAVAETAPVGGGTMVIGEDNAGDADGYFTDIDALALGTPVYGTGALVASAPRQVPAATDGVLVTIATTAYTAGRVHFLFFGSQPY